MRGGATVKKGTILGDKTPIGKFQSNEKQSGSLYP